jgi:hypothetical protein
MQVMMLVGCALHFDQRSSERGQRCQRVKSQTGTSMAWHSISGTGIAQSLLYTNATDGEVFPTGLRLRLPASLPAFLPFAELMFPRRR